MRSNELEVITRYLSNKNTIFEDELECFIHNSLPGKTPVFYRHYLSDLYKLNVLYRYDKGILKTCGDKKDFDFSNVFDKEVKDNLEKINPPINIYIWQLYDLNRFMSLKMFKNIIFVETYSYALDVVKNRLLNLGKKVVLEKDYNTYVKYNTFENLYVLKNIGVDSPIIKNRFLRISDKQMSIISSPKIEKIIVDIIVDDFLDTILGDETYNILLELLKNYKINIGTVRRYAMKIHKWAGVKFAIESTGFNVKEGEFK